jgi:hypothetical protein
MAGIGVTVRHAPSSLRQAAQVITAEKPKLPKLMVTHAPVDS